MDTKSQVLIRQIPAPATASNPFCNFDRIVTIGFRCKKSEDISLNPGTLFHFRVSTSGNRRPEQLTEEQFKDTCVEIAVAGSTSQIHPLYENTDR